MAINTKAIRRAPRWAWYTVGGIAAGTIALKVWKDRGKDEEPSADGNSVPVVDQGSMQSVSPSPAGVIVPPVIIGNQGDGGVDPTSILSFFQDGMDTLIHGYENLWGPVMENNQAILGTVLSQQNEWTDGVLDAIMNAGSAPPSSNETTTPVVTVQLQPAPTTTPQPAPQPATQQCPPGYPLRSARGCYKIEYENRTRDNGRTGSARKVWCNKVTIHRYSNGEGIVAGEDKIKDGAC